MAEWIGRTSRRHLEVCLRQADCADLCHENGRDGHPYRDLVRLDISESGDATSQCAIGRQPMIPSGALSRPPPCRMVQDSDAENSGEFSGRWAIMRTAKIAFFCSAALQPSPSPSRTCQSPSHTAVVGDAHRRLVLLHRPLLRERHSLGIGSWRGMPFGDLCGPSWARFALEAGRPSPMQQLAATWARALKHILREAEHCGRGARE